MAATDPEWRTGDWLPASYMELANRTLLAPSIRHPSEFSISELLERLVWARRLEKHTRAGGNLDWFSTVPDFAPEASRIVAPAGQSSSENTPVAASPGGGFASLRRLARRAMGRDPLGDSRGYESTLERLYSLKLHVPQAIKSPVKIGLGRLLVWAIERQHRARRGNDVVEIIDRRALEFFRNGGDLAGWQAAQVLAARTSESEGPRAAQANS
jgi:hypothetical protein